MRRFYIPPEQIGRSEPVISGDDAHHMRHVLRLRPGALVVVFDGRGNDYRARIVSLDGHQVRLDLISPIRHSRESRLPLVLAQGLLKDKKMDLLVRQLTELGFARWSPFLARRSVPAPDQKRMAARYRRWEKISLEAAKQCGRSRAMTIDPVVSFAELLTNSRPYDLKLICWEQFSTTTPLQEPAPASPASIMVMTGPEGGFSAEEVTSAQNAGFRAIGLGPRILRAETAALAAGVMVQTVFGDMGHNFLDNPGAV